MTGHLPGRLARVAVLLALVTAAARLAGFGRTVVFGRVIGRTCLGSVYAAANGVPNILFEIAAGGALAAVVVPLLARRFAEGEVDAAARTTSALLTWTVVALVPLTALTAAFARPIVSLLLGPATGCDRAAAVTLGTRMLLVFVVQILLYGVGIVLGGALQAAGRFYGPAVAPLLSSVVVAMAYVVYGGTGARVEGADLAGLSRGRELVLAGGTTLGVVVLVAAVALPLRRLGLRLRPTLRFQPGDKGTVAALALAGLASVATQQVATAVVIRLSNQVRVDSYVIYLLGATVFLLPWAVLAVPVATGVFPSLAAAPSAGEAAGLAARALRAVVLLMCAGTALLVATAGPAARTLLLGTPGQGAAAARSLATAIVAFAVGLVGYGVWAVTARALLARRAARTAAAATVMGWAIVTAADLILVRGATGDSVAGRLAAGQSVGLTVAGVLGLLAVRRAGGPAAVAGLARALAVGLASGAAACGVAIVAVRAMPTASLPVNVVACVVAAAIVAGVFVAAVALADRGDLRLAISLAARRG